MHLLLLLVGAAGYQEKVTSLNKNIEGEYQFCIDNIAIQPAAAPKQLHVRIKAFWHILSSTSTI